MLSRPQQEEVKFPISKLCIKKPIRVCNGVANFRFSPHAFCSSHAQLLRFLRSRQSLSFALHGFGTPTCTVGMIRMTFHTQSYTTVRFKYITPTKSELTLDTASRKKYMTTRWSSGFRELRTTLPEYCIRIMNASYLPLEAQAMLNMIESQELLTLHSISTPIQKGWPLGDTFPSLGCCSPFWDGLSFVMKT